MTVRDFEYSVRDDGSIYFDMDYFSECCGGSCVGHSGYACYHNIDHTLSVEEARKLYVQLWRVFQGRGDE